MDVLYLGQVVGQPSLVVFINKRDDPYAFPLDLSHPLIVHDIIPYGISYGLRAR
jgi:hypothetical protein